MSSKYNGYFLNEDLLILMRCCLYGVFPALPGAVPFSGLHFRTCILYIL